jgi:hypothetical protein
MGSNEKILLNVQETDVPILLDAIESFHEEVDSNCKKMKCPSCSPKRVALVRLKNSILKAAPSIGFHKE